jgi:hypothetical protein
LKVTHYGRFPTVLRQDSGAFLGLPTKAEQISLSLSLSVVVHQGMLWFEAAAN